MTRLFAFAHVYATDAYSTFRKVYADFRNGEEGQGTTEYAVLVVGVIAMATAVVGLITGKIQSYVSKAFSGL